VTRPRIFPPLIALAFAGGMWALHRFAPLGALVPQDLRPTGFAVMAVALAIDLWALGLFLRRRTTFHPLRIDGVSALVTEGIYGITRNPMYLGLLLWLTGFALYLGSVTPFVALPLFVWVLTTQQIVHEERVLEDRFGRRYRDYRSRVRRWI